MNTVLHSPELKFNEQGLIPAIIVADDSKEVLMLGYMNQESFARTMQERCVWFYSRSRQALWKKGKQSGNVFALKSMLVDCDQDCLLVYVDVAGKGLACHTGRKTCFFQQIATRQ